MRNAVVSDLCHRDSSYSRTFLFVHPQLDESPRFKKSSTLGAEFSETYVFGARKRLSHADRRLSNVYKNIRIRIDGALEGADLGGGCSGCAPPSS